MTTRSTAVAKFSKYSVWDKVPDNYHYFGDIRISVQHSVRMSGKKLPSRNRLDSFSRFDRTPTNCDRQTQTDVLVRGGVKIGGRVSPRAALSSDAVVVYAYNGNICCPPQHPVTRRRGEGPLPGRHRNSCSHDVNYDRVRTILTANETWRYTRKLAPCDWSAVATSPPTVSDPQPDYSTPAINYVLSCHRY